MKSMCHEARRNSPSVADCSPTSCCIFTTERIASILDRAQLLGATPPGGELLPGREQLGRTQQAADVIRAERR